MSYREISQNIWVWFLCYISDHTCLTIGSTRSTRQMPVETGNSCSNKHKKMWIDGVRIDVVIKQHHQFIFSGIK